MLLVPKAGLKSPCNTLKNMKLLKTKYGYAPFCAPSINFVKRWKIRLLL